MNRMTFLHKKSSKITFLTSENCTSKSVKKIIKELNTVNSMYKERDFNIEVFHGGNKLDLNALIYNNRPVSLNICEKGRHVPIIKRSIKSTKKGSRCTTHYVPYKRYTNLMTRLLVE